MLELGRGVPQNFEKAAQWFERAGHQGNAEALVRLGILCQFQPLDPSCSFNDM